VDLFCSLCCVLCSDTGQTAVYIYVVRVVEYAVTQSVLNFFDV
jgi:hypothetical protein